MNESVIGIITSDVPYAGNVMLIPGEIQAKARKLCWKYNSTDPSDKEALSTILKELLGTWDERTAIMPHVHFDYGINTHFAGGHFTFVNFDCVFLDTSPIHIGGNVFIGPKCIIACAGHPVNSDQRLGEPLSSSKPITIEENVWLGASVTVLGGVTIGKGSVIAAGAVVTRDIPAGVVAGGVPCKVIRAITETISSTIPNITLFLDYINYGGYPEVVFSERIQENPGQFIRHDIIDKVLLRDLPSLYGIQDVQELNSLFTMIAYHSGEQFSYEAMSKESGVKKELLKKYIQYLEAAFLIKVIHRTDDNAKKYQRDISFKIYLTNPSLRCALFQPIKVTDEGIGDMVETAVYAQWIPRQRTDISFANWRLSKKEQGEVDIVGIDPARQKPLWGVEIKWSDRYVQHPGELKSLLWYMQNNGLKEAIVTSETQTVDVEMGSVVLHFLPVACYAYTVGRNTLEHSKSFYGL